MTDRQTMASHLEPLTSDFSGASNQSGSPDASHPRSPPLHPHITLPSALRVKTAAHDRTAPFHCSGRPDDKVTENDGRVASFPMQPPNNGATRDFENDAVARCDNNGDNDGFGAAAPTAAAGPSVPQLLLPLMPAMIGPTDICSAEVWSKDPNFMMYCYKITPCTHRTPHDWRACPWAHPYGRAARRCPRMFVFASVPCANACSGRPCAKGAACGYSHNVTEYWLHPNRYCAEWCSVGLRCNRRLCFFAHSDAELRITDASAAATAPPGPQLVILQQQRRTTQTPYVDLLAHPAASLGVFMQTRGRPAEQLQRQQQQQQQVSNQQQQSLFDASSLDASASTDGARQHEILQLLMTAVASPAPIVAATQAHAASAVSDLMRLHQLSQQQQHRQASVSAVPAFCDLLGSVAPAPPAATQFPQAFFEQVHVPSAGPPKYILGAPSAELIAAILQGLPTV